MNDIINRKPKTLARWEETLLPREIEALNDNMHTNPDEVLHPGEVLDIIIAWEGGAASGYQIRSIISRVYGVKL